MSHKRHPLGARLPVAVLTVLLAGPGCRSDADDCRDLTRHLATLAEQAGQRGVGSSSALEQACTELRPSKRLVACMLDADSLVALDDC